MEQIAPNLMCNYGTKPNNLQGLGRRRWMMKSKTQQSAGIRNGAKGPRSTCFDHKEQIAPNSMCNDENPTICRDWTGRDG
eukprot:10441467-Ditylum_brightwellii.AAC.1